MARQIFAAEVSHEDTPLPIRERLAADEHSVKRHLATLGKSVDEVFILATCNRFTVYAISQDIAPLKKFFDRFAVLKGYIQYYYSTEESITHLFAVASGLLSPIKGDPHVVDQIRLAHQWALESDSIGISLDNLLNQAIRVGKKVRTESGIDKYCSSAVDAGIELLYKRLDGLHHRKIVVIGTGKIARLAMKSLYHEGIQDVCIVSRDAARAADLARLYYARTADIADLRAEVKNADVIIGGTHYEVSLFPESFLSGNSRQDKVWFILDFGMPRNFNSRLAEHSSIELYNLDDLKRLHNSPLDDFGGIEAAWTIVMKEAKSVMELLRELEYSPILVAYWNRLMDVRDRKANLLLPDLETPLTPQDIDYIRDQARRLVRKRPADPWMNTSMLANNLRAENPAEAVRNVTFEKIRLNLSAN